MCARARIAAVGPAPAGHSRAPFAPFAPLVAGSYFWQSLGFARLNLRLIALNPSGSIGSQNVTDSTLF